MQKSMLIFAVLVAFGTTLIAQTNPTAADEAAVRKLYDDERAAMEKNDLQALSRCFSDDFVVTNPFNRFLNKQQVLEGVTSGAIALKNFERKLEYVRLYGDTAVIAGVESGVWAGKMPLAGRPFQLRITGVARKVNGQWVEVARHASMILPKPAEAPPKS